MSTTLSPPRMYAALLRRDASYDGVFFVAVRSTGVFCRPSCPARKPKRENTEFYDDAAGALHAGFRPCKRCRPLATNGRPPAWIGRILERLRAEPGRRLRDDDLERGGVEPARARRYFRTHFDMTFQTYQRQYLIGVAHSRLRNGDDMTSVALDTGFDSLSGFRDAYAKTFGEPPGRGRKGECIFVRTIPTPIGALTAAASDRGVCLLEFPDPERLRSQMGHVSKHLRAPAVPGDHPLLDQLVKQLGEYFDGTRREFDLPLALAGTAFQQRVWNELARIPYGETISYAEQAKRLDRSGAQRAVGRANGQNRLSILLPCHRVVASDGQLRGYGGGLWRKQFLLDHERNVRGSR